ncbi:MAG: DNA primase [Salinivirgaceae bacterium]|nr:DNA primase [Salinivirgaceae bacterium]
MIDQETVNRIIDAANIVEVVSDFVSLKKSGNNYFGCCPFHNEKTASFSVSPAKNIFYCFGCHKGGNAVNFIMEHEQMAYVEALKYLAQKYHIEVKEKEFTPEEQERHDDRESMMVLNEFAKNTFIRNMTETDEGRAIGYKYFKERGFNEETIKTYELGYSLSERKAFTDLALKSGYQQKYLVSTGLSILKEEDGYIFDRFSNRVMFPIHNLTGKVIGFGGRVLDARTKGVNVKYMNSPQSEIYDKSRSLYGIYQAKATIVKNDKCFLVEGYTDVLSMHQSGITNVVASNGTALTTEQIRLIRKFTSNITVLYDGDSAGIKAALRGIDMILAEEMNVKVLLLPDGEDPDSFARNHSSSELEDFIDKNETDFILFKTKLLLNDAGNDPVKLSGLVNAIVDSISVVPDSIKRAFYVKECAELMNIDEKLIHREINKRLRKRREQWYDDEKKEAEQAVKTPIVKTFNPQQETVKRFREYEEELLSLLIKHGNEVLFILAKGDEPSVDVSVAQYIIKELTDNNIEFSVPICRKVLEMYTEAVSKAEKPDVTKFTLCADAEVSQFAVGLLMPKNEVSKKLWDKRNRYIPPEESRMKEVIDRALIGYKLELMQQTLEEIQKRLNELQKEPDSDLKISELMNEYVAYMNYYKHLNKYLGRTLTNKR